ncbi:hypothetical protein GA0074695_4443 [Micromonospora viridifaciens]|uniref:Uncharacterized protein n=1 Tax=Micromonospora viridifaciens TaxID=1881 RepID=A0A1C4YM39_MICVI|nr:hypothetical protein GA0074695_4443 [Micromonospora viridifaciens]
MVRVVIRSPDRSDAGYAGTGMLRSRESAGRERRVHDR